MYRHFQNYLHVNGSQNVPCNKSNKKWAFKKIKEHPKTNKYMKRVKKDWSVGWDTVNFKLSHKNHVRGFILFVCISWHHTIFTFSINEFLHRFCNVQILWVSHARTFFAHPQNILIKSIKFCIHDEFNQTFSKDFSKDKTKSCIMICSSD